MMCCISTGSALFAKIKTIFRDRNLLNFEILTCDPLQYKMDKSMFVVSICMGKSIRI